MKTIAKPFAILFGADDPTCDSCGSQRTHGDGFGMCRCMDCGGWSNGDRPNLQWGGNTHYGPETNDTAGAVEPALRARSMAWT